MKFEGKWKQKRLLKFLGHSEERRFEEFNTYMAPNARGTEENRK